jgi:hypothetical protein
MKFLHPLLNKNPLGFRSLGVYFFLPMIFYIISVLALIAIGAVYHYLLEQNRKFRKARTVYKNAVEKLLAVSLKQEFDLLSSRLQPEGEKTIDHALKAALLSYMRFKIPSVLRLYSEPLLHNSEFIAFADRVIKIYNYLREETT